MRPKRLISLLVAVCMMITMLPLSAVTAFAADTPSSTEQEAKNGYMYAYKVNADHTVTITKVLGPVDSTNHVDSTNNGPYDIEIPTELGGCTVTGLGEYSFSGYLSAAQSHEPYQFGRNIHSVTIPQSVTSIGKQAFGSCYGMDSFTIKDAATSIGEYAFWDCQKLETLSLGENITTIGDDAFRSCYKLETITLPAGLTSFKDRLVSCPAGFTKQSPKNGAIYYNNDKTAAERLRDNPDDQSESYHILANRNFLYLCKVTFDARGGKTDYPEVPVYKTEKITDTKANELTENDLNAINHPTRAGYKFTGWYTDDDQLFVVKDTAIMDDITLHAGWEFDPNAPVCHPLTLKDGVITSVTVSGKNGADPEDITEIVKKNANEDGSFHVPEGATVSVAFDKDAFADSGLKFGHWDITGLDDPNAYQDKESFAFEMPAKAVTLKAMTQDATIEDDGPGVLGTVAIIGTAAVGGAVLGYQAYSLGAEFAGKLMALPYFPSNRSALAMMLWEDAGKPMPESELLYPDVGQEEQDMDLQHAARWAMENELIPDLNDEGTAPEEMKFYPDNAVSKIDVLKAWQKAQELKQNA